MGFLESPENFTTFLCSQPSSTQVIATVRNRVKISSTRRSCLWRTILRPVCGAHSTSCTRCEKTTLKFASSLKKISGKCPKSNTPTEHVKPH